MSQLWKNLILLDFCDLQTQSNRYCSIYHGFHSSFLSCAPPNHPHIFKPTIDHGNKSPYSFWLLLPSFFRLVIPFLLKLVYVYNLVKVWKFFNFPSNSWDANISKWTHLLGIFFIEVDASFQNLFLNQQFFFLKKEEGPYCFCFWNTSIILWFIEHGRQCLISTMSLPV